MKPWKQSAYSFLCCLVITPGIASELLLLEPNIQGHNSGQIVHAMHDGNAYYLDVHDMADALNFQLASETNNVNFMGRNFSLANPATGAWRTIDGRDYYTADFYASRLPIYLNINPSDMQLDVFSTHTLPTTQRIQNDVRRGNIRHTPVTDSFENYEFDNRYFAFPVVDLIYRHNQNFYNVHRRDYHRDAGNFYQANVAMLLGAMDAQATIFGDDYSDHKLYNPGARIVVGQTLLDEPANALNLRRWSAGDIVSDGNNMFFYGAAGRGAMLSSFKDLVISADKTIDISGAMPSGWDAELYLNNQLIGFRQSGVSGRYEFKNIPVNYGLNDFKVVLYGPFGEVRTERRRFYSGTSPVRVGELGYNISVQQPNKYIINSDNDITTQNEDLRASSLFYYGLTDRLSLIGGAASTPHADDTPGTYQFSTIGAQMALNGVSMQYNLNYNMTDGAFGHHFDAQGDVYLGTLFARYEDYGDTKSPISYYQGRYLNNLFEGRLTGGVPWLNIPYYVSYTNRRTLADDSYNEIKTRLSPNFMRYYNFTVENTWSHNSWGRDDYTDVLLQATYGHLRMNGNMRYQMAPYNYLRDYGAFLEYRWDQNTYVQTTWRHDRWTHDMGRSDIDTLGIGIGCLFRFGGITLSTTGDTNKNISVGLTYNISFGARADRVGLFSNSENQMKNYGTIYAMAHDEYGNPVPDVKLIVSGRESPSVTDSDGIAIITNLEPYQKSTITIDEQNVPDLSLTPAWMDKKLVLRPGTVRPIEIPFAHHGGIEGAVATRRTDEIYRVHLVNADSAVVSRARTDAFGGFIMDGVPYGDYVLRVLDKNNRIVTYMPMSINTGFYRMQTPIDIHGQN